MAKVQCMLVNYVIDAWAYWSTRVTRNTSQATAWTRRLSSGQSTNKTTRRLMRPLWHGIEARIVMLLAYVWQRGGALLPTAVGTFQAASWDNYRCSALYVERTACWPKCVRACVCAVNSVCASEQCTSETCVRARCRPTWVSRYREVDECATNIAILHNRYEP